LITKVMNPVFLCTVANNSFLGNGRNLTPNLKPYSNTTLKTNPTSLY
jgi:hypothetical protein